MTGPGRPRTQHRPTVARDDTWEARTGGHNTACLATIVLEVLTSHALPGFYPEHTNGKGFVFYS